MTSRSGRLRLGALCAVLAAIAAQGCRSQPTVAPATRPAQTGPLRIVVMDPLADKLTGDCTPDYGQRKYDELGQFLAGRLGRPVELAHSESLASILRLNPGKVDAVIGKRSVVLADAAAAGAAFRDIALLTDRDGDTNTAGLFVVRADDPAKTLADLAGRAILLGPAEDAEKHAAALEALKAAGVASLTPPRTAGSCNAAILDVMDKAADAAVISAHSLPRMLGCGVVSRGDFRILDRTAPVPFVTVFIAAAMPADQERALLEALLAMSGDAELCGRMESRYGFVPLAPPTRDGLGWTDWRGCGRAALSDDVPAALPDKPVFLWRRELTGMGLSGLAATSDRVIVADKDANQTRDIWRCLDANDGRELWQLAYPAAGKLDYSNAPRANPVIRGELVYLLGAFGDLHCLSLADGKVLWRRNILEQFGAKPTQWGLCATPLVIEDRIIVNPGAKDASVAALDRRSGTELWRSPGGPSAYASFILAAPHGLRQAIGCDAASLGGWDVRTGRRLWTVKPPQEGDFNVPTPIFLPPDRLVVATENNGTRLYAFDPDGRLNPKPLAVHDGLAPDSSTPVVLGGRLFGVWRRMFCLDLAAGLKELWRAEDKAFDDYAALIAGNGRVLVVSVDGQLLLIDAAASQYRLISRLRLFDKETEIFSHPALLAGRLYVRTAGEIVCVLLR